MAIEFNCQNCQKTLRVADEFAGKKARCPNCQTILLVEGDTETVAPISVKPPVASVPQPPMGSPSQAPSYGQPGIPNASPFATSNPYNSPRAASRGAPHRGGIVLGLGIAAFFCPVLMLPGIISLFLGLSDLRAMKEGRMDNEGHGLTIAGTIIGGIATALGALLVLFYALLFFIAVTAG